MARLRACTAELSLQCLPAHGPDKSGQASGILAGKMKMKGIRDMFPHAGLPLYLVGSSTRSGLGPLRARLSLLNPETHSTNLDRPHCAISLPAPLAGSVTRGNIYIYIYIFIEPAPMQLLELLCLWRRRLSRFRLLGWSVFSVSPVALVGSRCFAFGVFGSLGFACGACRFSRRWVPLPLCHHLTRLVILHCRMGRSCRSRKPCLEPA